MESMPTLKWRIHKGGGKRSVFLIPKVFVMMKYKIHFKKTYLYALILEISRRMVYIVMCFFLALTMCFCHSIELFYIIVYPLLNQGKKLLFIDLTEALSATLQICFIAAIIQTIPFILYNFWSWFVVGHYPWERRRLSLSGLYIAISSLPAVVVFYCSILPHICQFFLNFEISTPALTIELESRIYTYITLVVQIIFFLGALYYLPWLLVSFIKSRLMSVQFLAKNRYRFTWFAALSAAFVSPPTFTFQFALFLLLILSYEFVVLFGCYYQKVSF